MATIQEMQKARELMKSQGLDLKSAVAQARAKSVTPVTPTVQTPVPTSTVTPTQDPTVQWVNWATFKQAPIDTATGLTKQVEQTPVQPAPVEPITQQQAPVQTAEVKPPEQPKIASKVEPVNYNTSVGREADVQKNLDSFVASGMDAEKLKVASWYETADPQKKAMIDATIAKMSIPIDEKSVLNSLIQWVSIPKQNTKEYRSAQFKYNQYNKYSTMTPTQLVSAMKNGDIWTETKNLLANNPNYLQAKEEYDKIRKTESINNVISSVYNGVAGTPQETDFYQEASDKIAQKLGINETNADAYVRIVKNDPDVLRLTKDVSTYSKQLTELNSIRNKAIQDLKSQKWDMSASAFMTLASTRTKDVSDQIDTLKDLADDAKADLKIQLELAGWEYEATSKDILAQQEIAKEQRAMQNKLDLNQAEFDQKIAQQAQLAKDPQTAIQTVMDEYKKLGIPFTESIQTKLQKANAFISKGGTIGQYVDQMIKDAQAKPEYQAYKNKIANEWVSFQTIWDKVYKVQNGTLVDTGISATSTKTPEWKQDASGNWYNANSTTSPWVQAYSIAREDAKTKYGSTPAVRNFNPWNIMDTWFGGKKVEWERFTVFDTPQEWFNALVSKIQNIQSGNSKVYSPTMTLQQYIEKYAPSSDNNNPTAYANAIAKNLWITTSTQIKDIDPVKLAEEHARHEDGNSYKMLKDLGIIGWTQTETPTWSLATLGQYMKDNQDRWQGYSNDDVKAFNEKINRLVKAWDEEWMTVAYRNMVMKDKDFKKSFDDTTIFANSLDTIQSMINDYEKAGKSTNALKAMAEKVWRKLWVTTDTALAQLQTQFGTTMANYIKSISGTAASDAEVQRLMGNMANIGNVSELNTAIVSQVKENAMNGIKTMINTRMYWLPEDVKQKAFKDIYWQTQQNTKPIYTDSDWKSYTVEELGNEMIKSINDWQHTPAEIKQWIIKNNLQEYYGI